VCWSCGNIPVLEKREQWREAIVREMQPSDEDTFRSGSGLTLPLRDPRLAWPRKRPVTYDRARPFRIRRNGQAVL
jgi:hypothetical protein